MFLKIMGALPGYVYVQDGDGLYVNLFMGSRADIAWNGMSVKLAQTTQYPWDGRIRIEVSPEEPAEFAVNVRLPGWSRPEQSETALYRRPAGTGDAAVELRVNGEPVLAPEIVRGYARLRRRWQAGDVIELALPMPVQRMVAHPSVQADAGRVALMRGPLVYCVETFEDGGTTHDVRLPADAPLATEHCPDLLGGVTVVHVSGLDGDPVLQQRQSCAGPHARLAAPVDGFSECRAQVLRERHCNAPDGRAAQVARAVPVVRLADRAEPRREVAQSLLQDFAQAVQAGRVDDQARGDTELEHARDQVGEI